MTEEIRSMQPNQTLWDRGEKSTVKGLHARAALSGKKAFYLYYRTRDGRQRRPKIGDFGDITLGEARRRAKILLDKVAVGEDPKGVWDERKVELSIQDLFDKTMGAYWSAERYQTSGWAREVTKIYNAYIKTPFGGCRLSEVTPGKVREWHRGFTAKPYTGNRALSVLSRMFNYAEELELRRQNSNPCHLVKNHAEKKRKRFATLDEMKLIAPLISKHEKTHPAGVAFLYLLMFTGSRPRAIERATWNQLSEFKVGDQNYGILKFAGKSSSKTGEDEEVVLPPQAMRALNRLPRIEGETITGIKMPRRLWKKIKEEAGCPDLWARDWRRTFATVGMSGGVDIGSIGELLNHHSNETTKIYAKVMDERKIEIATTIANRLEGMLG